MSIIDDIKNYFTTRLTPHFDKADITAITQSALNNIEKKVIDDPEVMGAAKKLVSYLGGDPDNKDFIAGAACVVSEYKDPSKLIFNAEDKTPTLIEFAADNFYSKKGVNAEDGAPSSAEDRTSLNDALERIMPKDVQYPLSADMSLLKFLAKFVEIAQPKHEAEPTGQLHAQAETPAASAIKMI